MTPNYISFWPIVIDAPFGSYLVKRELNSDLPIPMRLVKLEVFSKD
jgi:hypothetical protein